MEQIEIERVITEKGFTNWTKSVLAHNEAKKAFCELIEKKWKNFISKMTEEERHQIEEFIKCMKASEIQHFGTERHLSCSHHLCQVLYERLRVQYRTTKEMTEINDKIPCLPASDTCFQYYWNVAMLFGDIDDDLSKSDVIELDISNMLRMMSNCQLFAFGDSSNIYDKIYKDRDELFHTSENKISDERMYDILDNIVELLSRFGDDRLHVCIDVISNIKQLKKQDLNDEIEISVYRLLVEKNLKAKIKALENDMYRVETISLEEALAETNFLLLRVEESIEDEPDEICRLQEENDKLNEKIKELELERDCLQSTIKQIKQKEEEKKWIHLLEDENDEFIKSMRLIANATESGKDLLLLMEVLPKVIKKKEKLEHGIEPQTLEAGPSLVTTNLKELETHIIYSRKWYDYGRYYWHHHEDNYENENHRRSCFYCQYFWIRKNSKDCCKILKDCCRRVLLYPLIDLVIPLFRDAERNKREAVLIILRRQLKNLTDKFCDDITNLNKCYRNLSKDLDDFTSEHRSHSERKELESGKACVEKIMDGLMETLRLVRKQFLEPTSFVSFQKKWETFIWMCKTFAESAMETKNKNIYHHLHDA